METTSEDPEDGHGARWGSLPASGAVLNPPAPSRMEIRDCECCELTATMLLGTALSKSVSNSPCLHDDCGAGLRTKQWGEGQVGLNMTQIKLWIN